MLHTYESAPLAVNVTGDVPHANVPLVTVTVGDHEAASVHVMLSTVPQYAHVHIRTYTV